MTKAQAKTHTFTAAAAASQCASDNHANGVTDLLLVASILGSNNWLSRRWYWWLTVLRGIWEKGSFTIQAWSVLVFWQEA